MVVEIWDAAPALEMDAEASSLAELDLDLEGSLVVAGHGFGEGEPTSWALRLWPREADGSPVVHSVWRSPR